MIYLVKQNVKKLINDNGKQITKAALVSLDKKIEDYLWKLIRTSNGHHRIVPEVVNLIKM